MRYPVNYIGIVRKFSKTSHKGVDFGWNSNYGEKHQPIYAVEDGTVIYRTTQTNSGGKVIHIKHSNGYVSEYGHLETWDVKKGDKVKAGQKIGTMGDTGKATGCHLHFGLYKGESINYSKNNFVDPLNFICVYDNQVVGGNTQRGYKLHNTKVAEGIKNPPLNVRDSKNNVVGKIYNGDEVEYYGKTITGKAIVDAAQNYTTIAKYLK